MTIPEILKQIDAEIARLTPVRNIHADETPAPNLKAKRTLSAEARQRIGEAQRRRGAAEKTPGHCPRAGGSSHASNSA
ncbi:MAG: hypothetical protein QOJ51_6103 [Acidobacteriaceae bacterium]|nr:hypothetical protein [Acidobacteriaceae bacterium]